ncbi:fungal-specific transcription factor domain-containing protein [Ephemerocybe angulata]|uniref:Fungal-specific transcription factor domain-containing protein n=1 Tax=Ephemerocybe angulata TaxID=980116 RepID=A0A8H6HW77_9AGAR|nr:fungal-specific transcription factor domain-containing protein [Tulosesus angulatus]
MSSPPASFDPRGEGSGSGDIPVKKRRKGATRLSCAECRRLKLRCDRTIPCSSCVKRGCGAICPDTGLKTSHAKTSTEQHPLLSEDLLKVKMPLQREPPALRNGGLAIKEEENTPEALDAFGSLSISLSGRTKYFGHIANSWNESPEDELENSEDTVSSLRNLLPAEILMRASAFPIAHTSALANVGLQTLCCIYYSHAAWMWVPHFFYTTPRLFHLTCIPRYNPINIETFDEEVWSLFYGQQAGPIQEDPMVYHRLSLMFIVLAIGSLMDMTLPAYNLEAEKYHQLSRAAIFHSSLFDEPTLNAVQSLFLMTYYMFLSDRHGTNTGARWGIMGITIRVAQNRDSGKYKVDVAETQRRRELFWELFTYDSWQCYTFGRPPSFASPHFDTRMPFADDTSDDHAFNTWKHRFSSECMNLFHDQAFGAKTPTYATVLQLDRKMRSFPVPPILQVVGFGNSDPSQAGQDSLPLTLQRHIVLAIPRAYFFARAMSDHPSDPLSSPYGASVIAAYRSAGSSVALMKNLHRIWFLWAHMFSCAIILGSIVTRCPSMSFALSALTQLDSACELFSRAARGFRATKVLSIMLNLQQKAHYALDEYRKGNGSPLTRLNPGSPSSPVEDDELAVLGGKTRYVTKAEPSSPRLAERSPVNSQGSVDIQQGPSQQQHNGYPNMNDTSPYTEMDVMSPSSMYGMSSAPMQSPSYQQENSYMQHQQQQPVMQHQHQQQPMLDIPNNNFPQYFPVYDYSNSSMNMANGSNPFGQSPLMENVPVPGVPSSSQQRKGSGSPEAANMQTTWQDFLGIYENASLLCRHASIL